MGIPQGYVAGVSRKEGGKYRKTHLYKGTFAEPGLPMCTYGWNGGDHYSIFRNNISKKGICDICLGRALKGLNGIDVSKK